MLVAKRIGSWMRFRIFVPSSIRPPNPVIHASVSRRKSLFDGKAKLLMCDRLKKKISAVRIEA
jgi:hypothetical protein